MTFYALSALINAIISSVLSVFVYTRNRRDPRYYTHSLFCLSVAIWSYFYFIWQITPYEDVALFACRGLMAGAIFIPILYLHHLTALFDIYKQKRKIILYGYWGGLLFLILDFTPLYVKSVSQKLVFKFWPDAGVTFLPFLILWLSYVVYGVIIIINQYRKSAGAKKNQIRYVLLASFIGWAGGATNFPLWFNIPILPLGNIFVSGYMLIVTYAIVRYRLMDIKTALTRAGIFVVVYALVLGVPFVLGFKYGLWQYSTFMMLILATSGPVIYNYLRLRAERVLLRDQLRYQNTLRQLSSTMTLIKDLDKLLKLIVYRVAKAVKVDFACIYLADDSRNKLIQKSPYTILGFFPDFPVEITFDSALISFIKQKHKPIFSEELSPEIKKEFNFKSGLIISSFVRGKLLGFLLLGPKSSGAIYTPEDAAVFEVLANQAGLAIENTKFIEESQKTQAQLFAAERMTSMAAMAGGMSHQINNRLHAILLASSDTLDTLKFIDTSACSQEVKAYLEQLRHALGRIQENAQHGGKIINDFLDFSQPERLQKETKEVDLKQPLERAIEMVKIKSAFSDERIEKDIPEDLPRIQGDFALLQDTFFNLIDNAIDALVRKETAIKNKEIPHPATYKGKVTIRIFKSDSQITIQIQDNGIGMNEEAKKKIFVPFFTTKATSIKGTGLGLFVIQKIINAHQGEIKVSSAYGQGTTFTIILPLTQKK